MKKIFSMILVLMMLLNASAALAEGMGVQIIGGPEAETEPVSLDDFKLNIEASIEGYGILTGTSFEYINNLKYLKGGGTSTYSSGEEADYAILKMDILNDTTAARNYLSSCEVKVIYDDVFEFGGWCYQYDWDHYKEYARMGEDQFPINPMYAGHYCFGCTLPNAVVNSEKPLQMIITIDGNEITYNIRK